MKSLKNHKTAPLVKTITLFFLVLVPFLLVWLLVGEIDLLDVDWIVGINGSLWKGTLTTANLEWLIQKYPGSTVEIIAQELGTSILISAMRVYFDPLILACLFGCWGIALLYPIILKFIFKTINYDILPFSVGLASGFLIFIISTLIPAWTGGLEILRWIIRLLLLMVTILIFFFITNTLVNLYLVRTAAAPMVFLEMKNENQAAKKIKAELKKDLDNLKTQDYDYVDVEIKSKTKTKKE